MEVLGFIPNDGYTEAGLVVAVPGLYPALRIDFRPMLIEERAEYFKGAERLAGYQLRRFAATYLARHLKRWDLKDGKGEVVAITQSVLLQLKERLFNRLFAIVSTDEAPDVRPDQGDEEKDADLADALKAADTGRTLAEVREDRERGNSPPQ